MGKDIMGDTMENLDLKKPFKLVRENGFQLRFENEWTVGVQFGEGCNATNKYKSDYYGGFVADSAEVWCWNNAEQYMNYNGQTPSNLVDILNKIIIKPKVI